MHVIHLIVHRSLYIVYLLCYYKIYFRGLMDTSSALSMLTPLPILIVQGSMSPLPPPIISQSYSGNILGTYLKRETSVELSFDIFLTTNTKLCKSFLSWCKTIPATEFECTTLADPFLKKNGGSGSVITYFGIVY